MKRNRGRAVRFPGWVLFPALASFVFVVPAAAQTEHFVPADECMSDDCTCADAPMMEVFLRNQQKARDTWVSVREDLFTDNGPQSMDEAKALFESRFSGDSRVSNQFKSCMGYDPNVNSLSQIAAVPGLGEATLDPCFCDAFCKDIIDATVDHELTHGPTLLAGFANVVTFKVGCAAGVLPDSFCNSLDPMILADSEIISYTVGNHSLSESIEDLYESDPAAPEMQCTWEPLPENPSRSARSANREAPAAAPAGLWERFTLLAERFVNGAVR